MNVSKFTVARPIFTIMVVLIVLIVGGISLARLPIDLMPDITNPTLSVITSYENAGPEEVEESITRPIEEAMSAVPGVEEVTSASAEGSSSVRVTFAWGTDLDAAANDVRDRLDRIASRLPDDASKPTLRKFDLANFPILICGVSSETLDPAKVRELIDKQVKYRLERVPGVASLDIWGGYGREVHVKLDENKIKALGLSLEKVIGRIRDENINVPAGPIERGPTQEALIRTPGEFVDLDELRNTVIALRGEAPVRLRDVADVEDTHQRERQIVRVNGHRGLRLSIQKQSGTNTVQVAKAALAEIDTVNAEMPHVQIVPIIDTSQFIERSISNVGTAAFYGGLLSILVLLFFLRNVRSTLVIGTAIPVSIVATFALMYFGGFTLNIITLGGLALGVGMLVDNAIVVLENIYRRREAGAAARQAAIEGSGEVTTAIIASTLTTLAVFLPLLFVRGMAGVMYRQLSLVVGFALVCSLAAALTLVPMLAGRLLRRPRTLNQGPPSLLDRLFRLSERSFMALETAYRDALRVALNHRLLVIFAAVVVLGASLLLYPLIGSELMPSSDEGEVRVSVEMEAGTRAEVVEQKMIEIERIIEQAVPERVSMVTSIGGSGWRVRGANNADVRLSLAPRDRRTRSSEAVADDLRRRLADIAGATIRTRMGESVGTRMMTLGQGDERVQIEIRGHDLETAEELAGRVSRIVQDVPGVTDVRVSRESGNPEELVVVDRRKAAQMKVSVRAIGQMLQTSLAGTQAGNYRDSGEEVPILVQMSESERMRLSDVLDLTLTNEDGRPVVLRNVVDVRPRTGPVRIERKDQERIVTVSANPAGRDMGSILADIGQRLGEAPVPADFSIAFGGDYEEQQRAFAELMLSFLLALVLVYMVMACQFESVRDPFVVMFAVPLAAIGVMVMLFLTGTTFNIQSYIGCIMLGGIVVNNAILLVDHTNLLRRRDRLPLPEAIVEAGRRRLRPILMTATTTALGLAPLALGLGEGGEAQAPMARAVIGGLLSSTLITLLVVPVMYSIFERRMSHAAEPEPQQPEQTLPPAGAVV